MKKIKQFEKKVGQIQANIKNEADRQKQMSNKHPHPHQMPINHQGNFPMMPPMPHGVMQPPKMPMMVNHPQMGSQPSYPMVLNPQMVPQMGMPSTNLGLGMMNPALAQKNPILERRSKIDKMYERKAHFVESCKADREHEETVKKQCFDNVKFVLEVDLKLSPIEAGLQASTLSLIQTKSWKTMTSEPSSTS